MADAAPGGATKSSAKSAKGDAQKYFKKKPDPEGAKLIEQGEEALKASDFNKAKELFDKATELCKNSTAQAEKPKKEPKPAATEAAKKDAITGEGAQAARVLLLSKPADNMQAKPLRDGVAESYNYAANTPDTLKGHMSATGGIYRTRFPPEPNGYLHIGHAKAMNFNFGQARLAKEQGLGGETFMRFDDTNPTAEKQEYIDSILKNVRWLGNEPAKITYSSDYFQQLYDFALQLIKQGDVYVCHQTKEAVKNSRDCIRNAHINHATELPKEAFSPWRDTSVEENLKKFEKMRTGQYEEGTAFLRMKGDLMCDNPAMWDTAFYRVLP